MCDGISRVEHGGHTACLFDQREHGVGGQPGLRVVDLFHFDPAIAQGTPRVQTGRSRLLQIELHAPSLHEVARVQRRQRRSLVGREAEADQALAAPVVHVALQIDDARVTAAQLRGRPAARREQYERVE